MWVKNVPPPPPPKLTVAKHKATRHGNYFTVSLTVKNVGGDQAKDIVIKDNLLLLQPIGRNTAVARYSPDLVASAKSSDMVITSHVSIPPGQSRTYTFDAVPILPYPSGPVPMIGNYVDLKWSSPSQSGFTDYVQAPALKTTAGKLIVNAHSSALKSSDYLIVTSPNNLLSYNPASDVNDLLSSMAELARYRNGVLGYLDVPSSFVRSYQAHDGFAVGDVGGDTKHEIVIGDAQNDRIYVYQVTRRGFTYGGSAQFEIVWNTYAQFKAGLNQQGFEPGDRLAVGDLPGGTKSEIVMADASANTVLIYDGKGTLLSKFSVNLEPYDGLAVGDVTGDHKDEVVIADRSANKIYTYNYWGVKLTEFSKDYEAHDGIAAGDVWGNDKDEVIIGDRSANKVYTFSAGGSPRGSFSQTFDQGDGLAAGNAQWSWQNDKDEIVMGDADQNWVTIRKMDGTLLKSFSRDYESFDGLAVGKIVPGSNNDEVLVADRSENSIDIHDAARQGNKHLLRDLIKGGVKWGSLWTSSLYGTGVWSSKLKSDWVTKGYLLIVGETEIVPAWGDKKVGTAYTTRGNVELRTDAADYPYASTYGEETKPELSIGRIVGNSAKELRKPIEASVNVAKGTTGYGFDRSTALVVSGFAKGLGGGADDINFKKEADAAAKTLQGKNINTFTMHTPGYTLKDSSGAIDKKATEQAIENAFFGNISGIDVLFLTGHGNSNSWDVIGADDVLKQLMPFGSVNPFVFASSCATGSYQVGLSLAETFLSRGAAVYLGATKWGLGTHQWISNLLYSKWDTGESVALAVKQVNRSIGDYKFYNSSTGQYTTSPNKYERYWTAIYHVFGDAKYGAQGPAAAAVSSQSSPLSAAPPSSVAIQVPGYQTEQVNGQDFVTIPGGHVVALPGTPLVPYYQVSYDYPSGYQIQDVTLASRSEPVTATGLNIPWEVIAIGADGTSLPPVPEPFASLEWWPDQLFSWNVFEGPDTATLVISVFPFDYNPLTTDVKFYEDYQFNVSYTSPDVEITRLATDRSIYALGEAVAVDVEFHDGVQGDMPPAAKDIVVSTVVRSEATGEVVGGLPLRTLHGFTGSGAYSAAWDSSGFEGGYYTVEVELRDTQGVLLDTEVQGFSLGTSQVEITGLTATPEVFDIGNSVDLSLGYSNIGTTTVSGSAVIQVQDEAGQTVASFAQDFTDLAPSHSATFGAAWDTSGAEPGSYQAVGYVLYGGVVAGPIVVSMQSNTPHADAGPDQTVERSSLEGGETTLDGSASYDPDGDALSYEWSWPGGAASGVASVVVLPMGLTTVMLTVSDGLLSDSDTVDIRVVDTTPPEIAVEPPGAAGGLAGEVVFTADASDLSGVDGVYFWIRQANGAEGEPIGYEAVPGTLASGSPEAGAWTYAFDTAQLLDGSYILLAKAVDSYGNEAWSEVVPFEVRNWTVEERLPKSKKNRAGRTMPIKFSLRMDERADPAEPFVYREDLEVRVYDAADPGTILQASTYGDGSRSYRIDTQDELYITNFKTGRAPARYVVQIWLLANDFLLGSFTFSTDR